MPISERQAAALKKLAAVDLRKAGIPDLAKFEPHKLEWGNLNARQKDIAKIARKVADSLPNDAPESRGQEVELAHDALMEAYDLCEHEKDARTALGNRSPRPRGGDPRSPLGENVTDDGGNGSDPAEVRTVGLRPEQRMRDWAHERGFERPEGLDLGRYLRSMVLGARGDVEHRALAEGTDSAGGYTVPDVLSADLIDLLRARTVAIQAGARTIPLTSDTNYIAKVASDPAPAWRSEAGTIADSDPTFARVTLTPRSLAVMVKVNRELLEDSLNLETELPRIIARAMAVELDRVVLFGTGTAPQPRGVVNTTGVNAVAHDAALAGYGPLISARTAVLEANAAGVTAFVMAPRDEGVLAGLADTTGQPLMVPKALERVPFLTSTSVPIDEGVGSNESTIVTGHFPHLLIGIRNSLRIEVLRERYAEVHQYAFVAHMRADVAVEHAAAFTKITGIVPAA